ncbi:MAG: hypothetical protein ACAI44_15560 [Candidatus Sericytochromatia bacterium]
MKRLSKILLAFSLSACQSATPTRPAPAPSGQTAGGSQILLPSGAQPSTGAQTQAKLVLSGRILMPSGVRQDKNGILMPSGILIPSGILLPSGFRVLQAMNLDGRVGFSQTPFRVKLLDEQGQLLQSTLSDNAGNFSFTLPQARFDYKIVVEARENPDFQLMARVSNRFAPCTCSVYVEIGPFSTAIALLYEALEADGHLARDIPLENFARVPELAEQARALEQALIPLLGLEPLSELDEAGSVAPLLASSVTTLDSLVTQNPTLLTIAPVPTPTGAPLGGGGTASGAPTGSQTPAPEPSPEPTATSGGGGGGGGGSNPEEDADITADFSGTGLGEFQLNTFTNNNQRDAAIGLDADGDFVTAWASLFQDGDFYGVYAQRYSSAGTALGIEHRVNATTARTQAQIAIGMSDSGEYMVAWSNYDNNVGPQDDSRVEAMFYDSDGQAVTGMLQVNTDATDAHFEPAVAMDPDGDSVVAWVSDLQDGDNYGIFAQRYDAAGTPQGGEFQVNTTVAGKQRAPSVAIDAAGNFVIVWQSENLAGDGNSYGIVARRYNAAGVAQSGELQVNTTILAEQVRPAVAMDAAGDFAVVWTSYDQDGDGYGIYARRYNAAGVAQGGEIPVNQVTTDWQTEAAIAMDDSGDFVIAWSSYLQDGDLYGVYARRYDAAGTALGNEFFVNDVTAGSQATPAVAIDSDGDFAIAYQSDDFDGDDYAVVARLYAANGQPQ